MNNTELKRYLGKRIKELRNNKNLTQDALAEKISMKTSNLSNIETGKSAPSLVTIIQLINVLEVSPNEFFSFYHHKEPEDLKNEIDKIFDNQTQENQRLLYKIVKSFEN